MGRLESERLPWSRELGLLWEELRDGTLVFHAPTAEEKAAATARRRELFEKSNVPWILTDLGGLLGAYDDMQDVLAFTRWNGKISLHRDLVACTEYETRRGEVGITAALSCLCAAGRESKRLVPSQGAGWGTLLNAALFGAPFAALLAFLPGMPVVMWGLLAGQISLSLFGVGLRLGAIVGASQELTYRALPDIGFLWGVDHNKFNQLKRANLIAWGDKVVGSGTYLHAGDKLTGALALSMAYRDIHPAGEVVIQLKDYPKFSNLLKDPYGTVRAAANLAASLIPNAAAYAANDIFAPALDGLSKLQKGVVPPDLTTPAPAVRAAMKAIHKQKCPRNDACLTGVADYLRFLELLSGLTGDGLTKHMYKDADGNWQTRYGFGGPDVEDIALGIDNTIWGGLFRPVTAL